MRIDTKKRKNAMAGFKQMTGNEVARQSLHQIINQGKRALDDVFMGIGRMKKALSILATRK